MMQMPITPKAPRDRKTMSRNSLKDVIGGAGGGPGGLGSAISEPQGWRPDHPDDLRVPNGSRTFWKSETSSVDARFNVPCRAGAPCLRHDRTFRSRYCLGERNSPW